ncbi:hypothetical protein BB8028_0003g15830 [Beauveria bassiana]|uniref:Uncharacterized protein n=1 Tax=Beauveria bassiana TaxID=176275 RepID=A0A2S7Y9W3_BEABA|nr:hypothetical protein BB8028_0003g15830 [Beauveria bassiana]
MSQLIYGRLSDVDRHLRYIRLGIVFVRASLGNTIYESIENCYGLESWKDAIELTCQLYFFSRIAFLLPQSFLSSSLAFLLSFHHFSYLACPTL